MYCFHKIGFGVSILAWIYPRTCTPEQAWRLHVGCLLYRDGALGIVDSHWNRGWDIGSLAKIFICLFWTLHRWIVRKLG